MEASGEFQQGLEDDPFAGSDFEDEEAEATSLGEAAAEAAAREQQAATEPAAQSAPIATAPSAESELPVVDREGEPVEDRPVPTEERPTPAAPATEPAAASPASEAASAPAAATSPTPASATAPDAGNGSEAPAAGERPEAVGGGVVAAGGLDDSVVAGEEGEQAPPPQELKAKDGRVTHRRYVILKPTGADTYERVQWHENADGEIVSAGTPGAKRQSFALARDSDGARATAYFALGEPAKVDLIAVSESNFQSVEVKPAPPKPSKRRLSMTRR